MGVGWLVQCLQFESVNVYIVVNLLHVLQGYAVVCDEKLYLQYEC